MENLNNPSVIRGICEKYGFTFSKALGQNFLINPSVCPRIAAMGVSEEDDGVLEIGAGFGVLTRELAKRGKKVVVIEIDSRLLPVLDETLSDFDNVKVINQDVLKVDLKRLLAEEFPQGKVSVCANLPYYLTSPILMALLEQKLPLSRITVMVQKEAAARLCAELPSRQGGAVTAAVRYYSEPKTLFAVSRGSFMPAPKVDSQVISLQVKEDLPLSEKEEAAFFKTVKAAFAQRRKVLCNTLSSSLGLSKEAVAQAIDRAGIKPNARAEELSMEQLTALSRALPL